MKYKKKYLNLSNRKLDLIIGGMNPSSRFVRVPAGLVVSNNIQDQFNFHYVYSSNFLKGKLNGVYITAPKKEKNGTIFLVEYHYDDLLDYVLRDMEHDVISHSSQMIKIKPDWNKIKDSILKIIRPLIKNKSVDASERDILLDFFMKEININKAFTQHIYKTLLLKQSEDHYLTHDPCKFAMEKMQIRDLLVDQGVDQYQFSCYKEDQNAAGLLTRPPYTPGEGLVGALHHNNLSIAYPAMQPDNPSRFRKTDNYEKYKSKFKEEKDPPHWRTKKIKSHIDEELIHADLDGIIISLKYDNVLYSFITQTYISADREEYKTRTLLAVNEEIKGYIKCNGVITDIYRHTKEDVGGDGSFLYIYIYNSAEEVDQGEPGSKSVRMERVPSIIVQMVKTDGDLGLTILALKSEANPYILVSGDILLIATARGFKSFKKIYNLSEKKYINETGDTITPLIYAPNSLTHFKQDFSDIEQRFSSRDGKGYIGVIQPQGMFKIPAYKKHIIELTDELIRKLSEIKNFEEDILGKYPDYIIDNYIPRPLLETLLYDLTPNRDYERMKEGQKQRIKLQATAICDIIQNETPKYLTGKQRQVFNLLETQMRRITSSNSTNLLKNALLEKENLGKFREIGKLTSPGNIKRRRERFQSILFGVIRKNLDDEKKIIESKFRKIFTEGREGLIDGVMIDQASADLEETSKATEYLSIPYLDLYLLVEIELFIEEKKDRSSLNKLIHSGEWKGEEDSQKMAMFEKKKEEWEPQKKKRGRDPQSPDLSSERDPQSPDLSSEKKSKLTPPESHDPQSKAPVMNPQALDMDEEEEVNPERVMFNKQIEEISSQEEELRRNKNFDDLFNLETYLINLKNILLQNFFEEEKEINIEIGRRLFDISKEFFPQSEKEFFKILVEFQGKQEDIRDAFPLHYEFYTLYKTYLDAFLNDQKQQEDINTPMDELKIMCEGKIYQPLGLEELEDWQKVIYLNELNSRYSWPEVELHPEELDIVPFSQVSDTQDLTFDQFSNLVAEKYGDTISVSEKEGSRTSYVPNSNKEKLEDTQKEHLKKLDQKYTSYFVFSPAAETE